MRARNKVCSLIHLGDNLKMDFRSPYIMVDSSSNCFMRINTQ